MANQRSLVNCSRACGVLIAILALTPAADGWHPGAGLTLARGFVLDGEHLRAATISFGWCEGLSHVEIVITHDGFVKKETFEATITYAAPPQLDFLQGDECLYDYLRPLTVFHLRSLDGELDLTGTLANGHFTSGYTLVGPYHSHTAAFAGARA